MPNKAKVYVAWVAAAGLTLLATGLYQRAFPNWPRFLVFLALALVASTLKLRLPGLTGTMSANFLFILVGIADYTFSEIVVMGFLAALVQSVWKAKRRPQLVQVVFNMTSIVVSIGVAYWGSHLALAAAHTSSLAALMALAASLYFLTNTGLVALVLWLAEGLSLKQAWRQCYSWPFPYYGVGAMVAGWISVVSRSAGWGISLLLLPAMVLTHLYYQIVVERAAQVRPRESAEEPSPILVSSSEEI